MKMDLSLSAIRTNSTNEAACILSIRLPRWIFTVASLAPISEAICLLSNPETTKPITPRSRAVNLDSAHAIREPQPHALGPHGRAEEPAESHPADPGPEKASSESPQPRTSAP